MNAVARLSEKEIEALAMSAVDEAFDSHYLGLGNARAVADQAVRLTIAFLNQPPNSFVDGCPGCIGAKMFDKPCPIHAGGR